MTVTERFLDYVAYDTQSDGKSNTVPSRDVWQERKGKSCARL